MNKKYMAAMRKKVLGGKPAQQRATTRRESPLTSALMKKTGAKRATPMKRSGSPLTRALTKKVTARKTAARRAAGATTKKKVFTRRSKR